MTSTAVLLLGLQAMSADLQQQTFADGKKGHVNGVILSHEGSTLKVHAQDNTIRTLNISADTKIRAKHAAKDANRAEALQPGLYIRAKGKGDEKGELAATKVTYNAASLRTFRQADARAAVVETRVTTVEQRSEALENRAGQLENRTAQLDDQGKQTQTQVTQVRQEVGQVKTEAAESAQRINNVNERVSDLDQYAPKYSETVYFATASSKLSPTEKQKLDKIAQDAKAEKGYSIQVAGFADKTGTASLNENLSEARALAVIRYLQQSDVPLYRITAPAGMGTTHAVADNQTRAGRKLNRRVEVTVLVNQGLAGATQSAENSPATLTAAQHN
jgi:outer membrane protein OmpA-like peptidoglycan-associated protein